MVSLLELAEITEEGVKFKSPYDGKFFNISFFSKLLFLLRLLIFVNFKYEGSECLLTPERSIEIQNAIGADIIMQLDDVVSSTVSGPRVEEAMHRFFF